MNESLTLGIEIWRNQFGNSTSVLLTEFLEMFKSYISKFAKIYLNQDQLAFLSGLIDPTETKSVNFIEFMIFMEYFWLIPSKRMRLFKQKFNEPTLKLMVPSKIVTLTIYDAFLKTKKSFPLEISEEQTFFIGNDPLVSNLCIPEMKNRIQMGISIRHDGVLVRDYGKGTFRSRIKILGDRYILENDMLIKIGKETNLRVKSLSPQRICAGTDKKHKVLGIKFIGLEEEIKRLGEIIKTGGNDIRDVKTLRTVIEKNELENKVLQRIEERFLDLEITESGKKSQLVRLIPNEEKTEFLIGRGLPKQADILVNDMSVSKRQCLIVFEKSCGWVISEPREMKSYFGNFIYLTSYQEKNDELPTKVLLLTHPTTLTFDDDDELFMSLDF